MHLFGSFHAFCHHSHVQGFGQVDDQFDDLRLQTDDSGRVTDLEIDPYRPKSDFQSCDVFIIEKTLLEYLIEDAYSHADHDFIRDVLVKKVRSLKIYGYRYDGYVARLNSIGLFYKHNMALLDGSVRQDVFNGEHPIYTKVKDEVPARYGKGAEVINSIIADGCIIEGTVKNSVLFRGVHVAKDAVVENSILMQATNVLEGGQLSHVVADKGVTVKRGRKIAGYDSFPVVLRKNMTV